MTCKTPLPSRAVGSARLWHDSEYLDTATTALDRIDDLLADL
jgi:hypothetical protein